MKLKGIKFFMLNMSGHSKAATKGASSRKTWMWMLLDSAIIAAIGFFSALPDGIPTWEGVYVAGKAFCIAFVLQLAIERGLKRVKDS